MSSPIEQRAFVELPVGVLNKEGELQREAEVRAVTGGDEFYIGMSAEYTRNPNDLVYKTLLLSRCVRRIGTNTVVTMADIKKLHVQDVRALEYAIYKLSYGAAAIPKGDPSKPGGSA
ncbi:MAG: hypothetical protein CL927_10340 [Deltaproteobacteria bacterium]|nr:hypothetical protein [Deltaproteobacteria bacterium]HCH65132.1 hypothetical protein [Deltaproteobacteria bacterium]